ncbi:MAG: HD domain-containing phosphohydrolase [Gemmatimonadota bacterium]
MIGRREDHLQGGIAAADDLLMLDDYFRDAEILIVDDEPAILRLLALVLDRADLGRVTATADVEEALQLCVYREPDLILVDLHMPGLSGVAFMRELRSQFIASSGVPVIVMTGDGSAEAMDAAFKGGARDFLRKPLEAQEVTLRIRNQLELRFLNREVELRNRDLECRVRERTKHLHLAQIETIERLARAAEYRDDDTGEHAKRVGQMSAHIADVMGLPADEVELIWRSAALHDVGKIGVTDRILLKPGKLTDEEITIMRRHAAIGASILAGGESAYMQMAERIAMTHHERWDGGGYHGLSGTAIPVEGRIVAVADVFDALIHERPYKEAWPVAKAVAHIEAQSGQQFDPAVVNAFLQVLYRDGVLFDNDDGPPPATDRLPTSVHEGALSLAAP